MEDGRYHGLAVDKDDNIWVLNRQRSRVHRFTGSGIWWRIACDAPAMIHFDRPAT
jgi:sugar lactone lactonase YvrE